MLESSGFAMTNLMQIILLKISMYYAFTVSAPISVEILYEGLRTRWLKETQAKIFGINVPIYFNAF